MKTLLPAPVPPYRITQKPLIKVMGMNSIGGFLSVTALAAIVISHPFAAKALSDREIAQITIPPAVQINNPLDDSSGVDIAPGKVEILHPQARNVLASREKDPPPPSKEPPGGTR